MNLPITTAIVHSVSRVLPTEDGTVQRDDIKVRDYWNICGRAGRAGIETQGQILHIVESVADSQLFEYYADRNNIEPVESRLLDILRQLVTHRISDEEMRANLGADLLAVLVEESVGTPSQEQIESILGDSLVKIQADDARESISPLVAGMTSIGRWVIDRVTDVERRRIIVTTGLSIESCESLEASVRERQAELESVILADDLLALAGLAYQACASLNEIRSPREGPSDVRTFLADWIKGLPIPDLWARHADLREDRPIAYERLSRFVEDLFVYRLPWGFNAYTRIASYVLSLQKPPSSIAFRYLASMVKFGLPDHVACWARSLALPTRGVALGLAVGYRTDGGDGADFVAFLRWLARLSAEDLFFRFNIRGYALERTMSRLNRIWTPSDTVGTRDASRVLFEVRGLQYDGRRLRARGARSGSVLRLEREPENLYDSSAIRVFWEGKHIGYVAREVARVLALELDSGETVVASMDEVITASNQLGPDRIFAVAYLDK